MNFRCSLIDSIFKYMKLKSYDRKNIYLKKIFIPNIFPTTLRMNECHLMYLSKKNVACKIF